MILRMGRQPGRVGGGVAIAPGVAAHEPYARRAMAALRPGFGLSKLSMTARSEPDTSLIVHVNGGFDRGISPLRARETT